MTTATEQLAPAPAADAAPAAAAPPGRSCWSGFPPRPAAASWPATQASRSSVLTRVLAPPFALEHSGSQQTRRLGVLAVLSWLQTQPGDSWQDRWLASGAQDHGDWRELVHSPRLAAPRITGGTAAAVPT